MKISTMSWASTPRHVSEYSAALVLAGLLAVTPCFAQPTAGLAKEKGSATSAPASPPQKGTSPGSETPPEAHPLSAEERDAHIKELLEGKLDPKIRIEELFTFSLDNPQAPQWLKVEGEKTATKPTSALAQFQALSERRKERLLEIHRQAQENYRDEQDLLRRANETLAETQRQAQELKAYLAGALPLTIQPSSVLDVDLLAAWALTPDTPQRFAPELQEQIKTARSELATLRAQYLALSPDAREGLLKKQESRISEEKKKKEDATTRESVALETELDAASRKKRALEDAERASTETARLIAEERARLYGTKEEQARFTKQLEHRAKEEERRHERSLSWSRRVGDFLHSDPFASRRESEASRLYGELVDELRGNRSKLREALNKSASDIQAPGPPPPHPGLSQSNTNELDKHREELRREQALLENKAHQQWKELASALRDDVVAENALRLELMNELSSAERGALKGLGPEGVAQVRREVEQTVLEARYHFVTLKDALRTTARQQDVIVLLFLLTKLAAVGFVFRWWRRRAPHWIQEVITWGRSINSGPAGPLVANVAWYLDRARPPIEWFLFAKGLLYITGSLIDIPETQYLGEVIAWTCFGNFGVRWVDAVAARQSTNHEQAALRFRSLRLVAIVIVTVVLLLRLARLSVGEGALYSWIGTTSLILTIPLILRLLVWWRPTVLARAASHATPSRVMIWASKNNTGLVSLLATGLAGTQLLLEGLYRFAIRRASHLQATQRVLAYLFRRELEKRATGDDEQYEALPPDMDKKLHEAIANHGPVDSYAAAELDAVADILGKENNAVIALVAERGLGKSHFGERVKSQLDEAAVIHVKCTKTGFSALLKELRESLELDPKASQKEVVEALRSRAPRLVWLDDATRLVRPLIGGLRDFDRLARLAREVGGTTSWLLGIGSPAWNYLSRARGDRAIVDTVIRLPRWTEAQIAELTSSCADVAELELCYDDLVVPRQMNADGYDTTEDHTEKDYGRLLWDFSDGNPLVALYFFSQSVRLRAGQPHIRLFSPPSASQLEELPPSVHFVLRAVLQLGLASESDIVKCTGLSAPEVADALRLCRGRKYLEIKRGRFSVSIHWFRMITQVLRRQHLLIG